MTDWPVRTLGDVCEVIAGQSPEGQFYNKEGKGVPFYQGKKDFAERVLGSPTTWTSEVTKLARPGDILMSVRAPVGPVNLCTIEACIGRGLAAIRHSSKTDTDFIYYYLECIQLEIAGTEGAVFASINKAQIAGLRCPVPPLEEQKRIVDLLDAATACITELAACYEQARTQAANLFTSALRDALESNPDWPVKTLGDLMLVQNGYAFDSKFFSSNGKIGLIRIRDLKNGLITEARYEGPYEDDYLVSAGDYLVGMDGEFRCYEWKGEPALLNQRVCRLRGFDKSLESRFLFFGINKFLKDIEDVTGYTTVKHLSSKSILAIEMPVPPLEEQMRIVAQLDSMRAKTSEMVAAYDSKLTAAKNLRQSILEAAFAGEL